MVAKTSLRNALAELDAQEKEATKSNRAFARADSKALKRAFASGTPVIGAYSYWPEITSGTATDIAFEVYNPTLAFRHSVNVSFYFGAAGFIADPGVALSSRDTRWPYLSIQQSLLQGQVHTKFTFKYNVPVDPDFKGYHFFGNATLWRYNQLFDRIFATQKVKP